MVHKKNRLVRSFAVLALAAVSAQLVGDYLKRRGESMDDYDEFTEFENEKRFPQASSGESEEYVPWGTEE